MKIEEIQENFYRELAEIAGTDKEPVLREKYHILFMQADDDEKLSEPAKQALFSPSEREEALNFISETISALAKTVGGHPYVTY